MEHDLRPPGDPRTAAPTTAAGKSGDGNSRLWLLFGSAIAILLVVVLVLPAWVPESAYEIPADKTETILLSEPEDSSAEIEQQRTEAELALQDFLRLQAQPGLQNAETWAADSWHKAMEGAGQGDDAFGEGRFAAALESYISAGRQLQLILDNREQTQQQLLADGWRHLEVHAVNEAVAVFRLVLLMQADNEEARAGIDRAMVREQVLELLDDGQQAELGSQLQLAVQAYRSALQLDPLYEPAQLALEKIENEISRLAFQDAMGRALLALDNGKFASAEKALNEAAGIKPGDRAIKDFQLRLLTAKRQDSLMKLRRKSEQLASKEDWAGAAQAYSQALAIETKASFAVTGLARAQQKLQLHQQLDHYLADTGRLSSDEPLSNARQLLAANPQVVTTEPLLSEKIARLQEAVRLAVLPVNLLLLSDNLTQVSIYKVGRLGNFEQKQLSLRPGTYTITGSRRGYRDVLKVIELKPGSGSQSLEIRSEEAI